MEKKKTNTPKDGEHSSAKDTAQHKMEHGSSKPQKQYSDHKQRDISHTDHHRRHQHADSSSDGEDRTKRKHNQNGQKKHKKDSRSHHRDFRSDEGQPPQEHMDQDTQREYPESKAKAHPGRKSYGLIVSIVVYNLW